MSNLRLKVAPDFALYSNVETAFYGSKSKGFWCVLLMNAAQACIHICILTYSMCVCMLELYVGFYRVSVSPAWRPLKGNVVCHTNLFFCHLTNWDTGDRPSTTCGQSLRCHLRRGLMPSKRSNWASEVKWVRPVGGRAAGGSASLRRL